MIYAALPILFVVLVALVGFRLVVHRRNARSRYY